MSNLFPGVGATSGRHTATKDATKSGVYLKGTKEVFGIDSEDAREAAAPIFRGDIENVRFHGNLKGSDVCEFLKLVKNESAEVQKKEARKEILRDLFAAFGYADADMMATEVVDQGRSITEVKKAHENATFGIVASTGEFFASAADFKTAFEGRNDTGRSALLGGAKAVLKRGDTIEEEFGLFELFALGVAPSASPVQAVAAVANGGASLLDKLNASLPADSVDVEFDGNGNPVYRVLYGRKKNKPVSRAAAKAKVENDDLDLEVSDFHFYKVKWLMDKNGNWVFKPDLSASNSEKVFAI